MKVANNLAPLYTFGYYDKDDIAQEAIIIALEVLDKYDPKKSALETFLYIHLNNRLKNLRRDRFQRTDYICPQCNNSNDDCENCYHRKQAIQTKKNLLCPISIDNVRAQSESNLHTENDPHIEAELNELLFLIDLHLPVDLRADYLRMRDGVSISKSRRDFIELKICEIIEDHYHE